MNKVILTGAQWGDEGKAKITDLLSEKADIIMRFQGGANAGHTVVSEGKQYKLHLIPSGILHSDKKCIIGAGTVINPAILLGEMQNLKDQGISLLNLYISGLAHITMPWHIDLDRISDTVGSTGRGIGPTYGDKTLRRGIILQDLLNKSHLQDLIAERSGQYTMQARHMYQTELSYDIEAITEEYHAYGVALQSHIQNITEILDHSQSILFEGAQGTLLDITYGTYPYVTSSHTVTGGACIGAYTGPSTITHSIGIYKAFISRVGLGVFPTEIDADDDMAATLRQDNTTWAEYGTTTGRRRRVGWFDLVLARYATRINGYNSFAITKLDTLDALQDIKICVAYQHIETGDIIHDIDQAGHAYLSQYTPVYETLAGWYGHSTFGVADYNALPAQAQAYVAYIEEHTGISASIISTGPDRQHSIIRNEIFGV